MSSWTQLKDRSIGMITDPVRTLQSDATPAPPLSIVFRQHVVPLLVATGIVTLAAGAVVGQMSLLALLGLVLLRSLADAILIRLAAVFMTILGRASGAGNYQSDATYALAALAASPYLIGQSVGLIPGFGIITLVVGAGLSLRAVWMGAPLVLNLDPSQRGRVIGFTAFGMVLCSLILGAAMLPILAGLGFMEMPVPMGETGPLQPGADLPIDN
jgi:hypothetical protein